MILRKPVVAGRFYSADGNQLKVEIDGYLEQALRNKDRQMAVPVWGVMLPHAGHVFCGDIIGATLDGISLPSRLVILCPNHTGYGKPLGVWASGAWQTPLGTVGVDEKLAAQIVASGGGFEVDADSHMAEHSIEVLLPFLQEYLRSFSIVPICVGIRRKEILEHAGQALSAVLEMPENSDVGVVVSSDMNHYESHDRTLAKDQLAIDCALAGDAARLLDVTDRHNISMCGAAPMALAMFTAQFLGDYSVSLAGHTTSGPVSGDYGHTVGYAGLRLSR